MKKKRIWNGVAAGLIIAAAVVMAFTAGSERFLIEEDGVRMEGLRIPLLYEHVAMTTDSGEDSVSIELDVTPFSRTTWYQEGGVATSAALYRFSDTFSVLNYAVTETGDLEFQSEETVSREEAGADFYSPLLCAAGDGRTELHGLRVNTPFGLYEVSG